MFKKLVDGKMVIVKGNSKNVPPFKIIKQTYAKIPDNKKIPIVFESREQYLDEYIKNQEKAKKIKFKPSQIQAYKQKELANMTNIVSRYTTDHNPYINRRVVFFTDRKIPISQFKDSAIHEYGHEIYEKNPKIRKDWKSVSNSTSPTTYGKTAKQEDFAESYMLHHKGQLTDQKRKNIITKDIHSRSDIREEIGGANLPPEIAFSTDWKIKGMPKFYNPKLEVTDLPNKVMLTSHDTTANPSNLSRIAMSMSTVPSFREMVAQDRTALSRKMCTDKTSTNMAWAKGLNAEDIPFAKGTFGEPDEPAFTKKRVLMPADIFLKRQYEQRPDKRTTYSDWIDVGKYGNERIAGLKEAILDPDKEVPVPIEEYNRLGVRQDFQEGRHRGLAAQAAGVDVPVILARKRSPPWDRVGDKTKVYSHKYDKTPIESNTEWDKTTNKFQLDTDTESTNMAKVYHGTDALNAFWIGKEGIKTSKSLKQEGKLDPAQSDKTDSNKTYFFDKPEHALSWAKVVSEQSGVKPAVIEADIPDDKLVPDFNMKFGKAYSHTGDVPVNQIRILKEKELKEE